MQIVLPVRVRTKCDIAIRWRLIEKAGIARWRMERMGLVRPPHPNLLATVMVQTIEAAIFELAARDEWELNVIETVLENFYWNALFGWRGGPTDFVVVRAKRPKPVFSDAEHGPSRGRLLRRGR